jgi:hypothetical protein
MLLQLDARELDVVHDVLRRAMGELREEIYKTEAADFEAQLKSREAVLNSVLTKIAAAEASGVVVGEPASMA